MTVRILDDISQESCVGLELVGRRSSTINTYWIYTLRDNVPGWLKCI